MPTSKSKPIPVFIIEKLGIGAMLNGIKNLVNDSGIVLIIVNIDEIPT